MILNGNQRGGAKDLALHLMKTENERVEVHELRGFMSQDLMGALNEMYAVSRATKCTQFMYSLSLNPPKDETVSVEAFAKAIEEAEQSLGLQGQARAVVFHEKIGMDGKLRRHCHVVWNRIDLNTMTAKQMSHDREKLTTLSRELFLEYGWEMPDGLKKRGDRDSKNFTHAEHQQAQRHSKSAKQIKTDIQSAWAISDNRVSFEHALAEHGYLLARGDTGRFVVVDMNGEIYSLPKQLAKGINTKDVRNKIGDESELTPVANILELLDKRHEEEQPSYDRQEALELVTRYHAAFTLAMMERNLKQTMPHKAARQKVMHDILNSGEVIKIGKRNGADVYALPYMMNLEQRMVNTAHDMAQNKTHPVDKHALHRSVYTLNAKLAKETNGAASLSQEQVETLRHMTSDKQLSLVVGVAGAGKTTIMEGAKTAFESEGYRVRGAAPSGIAAAGLKDIGMNASTLHALEYRAKLAQEMMDNNAGKPLTPKQRDFIENAMLSDKDVLIIDEAGMVSTKQMANIIEMCRQSGAKLVLVGDPNQLQSVEAGAAFRTLLERNESASLTEVRRQKTDWQREATIDLSKGNVSDALEAYAQHNCIQMSKNRMDAKEQLVADYMKSFEQSPENSRIVLAYTRKDVAELNAMIKTEMLKQGRIANDNTEVSIALKSGEDITEEKQHFSVGDRVMFTQNNRDLGVMNGSLGTLEAIRHERFHVKLDNGKTVIFSPDEYNAFQLGYAATVHKSQGITVDESYVLATPHFDRHTSYVALSRHKYQANLYASQKDFKNKGRMHASLGKRGDNFSTLDFVKSQNKEHSIQTEKEQAQVNMQDLRDYAISHADLQQHQGTEQNNSKNKGWER